MFPLLKSKKIIFICLSLLCILIPLIISMNSYFIAFFKPLYEGIDDDYLNDMDKKLSDMEDIYNDICDGKKSDYVISDQYKRTKMLNIVLSMKDNDEKHTYKTDLKKILEDATITDESVILKNTMNTIKEIKTEIKSSLDEKDKTF